ncbi:MAG: PKD-like domain-containing protein, partial [Cyclobacteriaceae bacterium]
MNRSLLIRLLLFLPVLLILWWRFGSHSDNEADIGKISANTSDHIAQSQDSRHLVSYGSINSLSDLRTKTGFFENNGQLPEQFRYVLRRNAFDVILFNNSFGYLVKESATSDATHFTKINLLNANPNPVILEKYRSKDRHNYIKGQNGSVTGVHHFAEITYQEIYPRIDLVFSAYPSEGYRTGFKYSFIVHPGGNPDDIRLAYEGPGQLELFKDSQSQQDFLLAPSGQDRVLDNAINDHITVREVMKEVYTVSDGFRVNVRADFKVDGSEARFAISDYDKSKTLVIDPDVILLTTRASTYYGTEGTDRMRGVASDASGNIYVVGQTPGDNVLISTSGTFQAAPSGENGDNDIILARFSSDLSELQVATYYGGNDGESAFGIAVDALDNVYITGSTGSIDLPLSSGTHAAKKTDALVAKFNPELTDLLWSTPISGDEDESGQSIEVANGKVYVTGSSSSSGLQNAGDDLNGRQDAYTAAFDVTTGVRQWFRYFGQNRSDEGNDLSVEGTDIYVTGSIEATRSNNSFFVAHYNENGDLVNSYVDPQPGYNGEGIDVSTDGQFVILVGFTDNDVDALDNNLPASTYGGGIYDGYMCRIKTSDLSIEWATYYGGNKVDVLQDVKMDCNNNISAIGYTRSLNTGNAVAINGVINQFQGGGDDEEKDTGDALLIKYSPEGERIWGSYFGDGGDEEAIGITFGATGNIIICGATSSGAGITTAGTYDSLYDDRGKRGTVGFITTFCDVVIDEQPQDVTVPLGGNASFSVGALSCGSITGYQWYRGNTVGGTLLSNGATGFGSTISGANSAVLNLNSVTFGDEAEYCVKITTLCGEAIELCAILDIVDLKGNDVCLDFNTTPGNPSASQDTVKLTFVDLENTPNITNAVYSWKIINASTNEAGANQVVAGTTGAFPLTLPMTGFRDDLYEIKILPTGIGSYTYQLNFVYDDDRRPGQKVADSISVTVQVFSFPTITNLGVDRPSVCESDIAILSISTDLQVDSLVYRRIDANTTNLSGNNSGKISGNPIADNPASIRLNAFSNITNVPLEAIIRVTPYSTEGCEGASRDITISVKPEPDISIQIPADTICSGASAIINFSARSTPADFTANGGTVFSFERLVNAQIAEAPINQSGVLNSGSVNEILTNTSDIPQLVTYQFTALYDGCQIMQSANIVVMPSASVSSTQPDVISLCSGEELTLDLLSSYNEEVTILEVTFSVNGNVTGLNPVILSAPPATSVNLVRTFTNTTSVIQSFNATVIPFIGGKGSSLCVGIPKVFNFTIAPNPVVTNDTLSICDGEKLDIELTSLASVSSGINFRWTAMDTIGNVTGFTDGSGPKIEDELVLSSGSSGRVIYTVVAEVGGCQSEPANITVNIQSLASVVLSARPFEEVCDSSPVPVVISAAINESGTNIRWFRDNVLIAGETGQNLRVTLPGTYEIAVETASGCITRGDIEIDEVTRTTVSIEAPGTTNTCSEEVLILTTSLSGAGNVTGYQWLKDGLALAGENQSTLTVPDAGNYQVVINGQVACPDSSNVVNVNFFPQPQPEFALPVAACPDAAISLTGNNNNPLASIDVVAWEVTGSAPLPVFTDASSMNTVLKFGDNVTGDSQYEVTFTLISSDNCSAKISKTITHQRRPVADFSFKADNCAGNIALENLSASGGDTFLWEVVSGDADFTIDNPADLNTTFTANNMTSVAKPYDVKLTVSSGISGCSTSVIKRVTIYPQPEVVISGATSPICNGGLVSLSASSSASNTENSLSVFN